MNLATILAYVGRSRTIFKASLLGQQFPYQESNILELKFNPLREQLTETTVFLSFHA